MRPDAPALTSTDAFGHWNRAATSAMSSRLALPSTGGDFSLATQVPSGCCSSDEDRAFGFTLTLKVSVDILSATQRPTDAPLTDDENHADHGERQADRQVSALSPAPKDDEDHARQDECDTPGDGLIHRALSFLPKRGSASRALASRDEFVPFRKDFGTKIPNLLAPPAKAPPFFLSPESDVCHDRSPFQRRSSCPHPPFHTKPASTSCTTLSR